MNLVLYVHDPTLVWPPTPAGVEEARRDIEDMIANFTMERVTVDLIPENKALGDRVEELENMISGNIDDWQEAHDTVEELVRNWDHGDIAGPVNALRIQFGIENPADETDGDREARLVAEGDRIADQWYNANE